MSKTWFLVLSRLVPGAEEGRRQHFQEHMDWLNAQHKSGRMLLSGPTPDRQMGIYLMRATDIEEAAAIAASDPHHIYGERVPEVYEWEVMQLMRLDGGVDMATIESFAGELD